MGGALADEGRAAVRAALVETWDPGAVGDAPATFGAQARSTGAHRNAGPDATSATMPSMAALTIDIRTAPALSLSISSASHLILLSQRSRPSIYSLWP